MSSVTSDVAPRVSPPFPSSLSGGGLGSLLVLAGSAGALLLPAGAGAQEAGGQTRTYYVAADTVRWDYAPEDMNRLSGDAFEALEKTWVEPGPDRIGKVYKKAVYREYTDESFTRRKERTPEWEHLGMLGPLLRAEVGDTIRVVFRNRTDIPVSMHPHGVSYTKGHEGARYDDGTSGADKADDAVPPGGGHTYLWPVPERAGPAPDDLSSVLWPYHSHVDEPRDVNTGLMGAIIVTRRGQARPDGTPKNVDRELVVSFHEMDENLSHYLDENIDHYAARPEMVNRREVFFWFPFGGSNFMESMNGYLYANLPGLEVREGERVRWYLMSSTNFEVHSAHWHGNTVVIDGKREDVTGLIGMERIVADMVPDNPGTWTFHCHVKEHVMAGMSSLYRVLPAER